MSVNYHGLSDFRVAHPELLDQLLIDNVAALSAAGIIDLDEVTQDGLRVRAAAGASSFRRGKILREELEKAKRMVEQLKQEPGRDIAMSGSITLVGSLLREGLLDELSLLVSPIVLGKGKRLFEDPAGSVGLKLVASQTLDNGVLSLTYARADS